MTDIKKNSVYRVNIEDLSAEGMGVARLGGFVVFVKGGVRGDMCEIKLIKVARNAAWAIIERIIEPSPYRTEPGCAVYPKCGGCDFQHVTYEEELSFKERRVHEALKRIGGVELKAEEVIGAEKLTAYRNKAIFPVGEREGRAISGFYRENSHDIVPMENCPVQSIEANIAVSSVRAWMDEFGIRAYDEASGEGAIRRVFVRTNAVGESLVCIISAGEDLKYKVELVKRLTGALPLLQGIVLNVNPGRGNAVLSDKYVTLWGERYLEDTLCGLSFRLSAPSFYQINRGQAQRLYDRALDYAGLDKTMTVLDLYCGTGTITLCMAKCAGRAVGVEISPEAISDARENSRRNGIENAEFICADAPKAAEDLLKEGFFADVITVDPPRKGLDASVIDSISALSPKRVVYISCDPGTLARDIKLLSQRGYAPSRLTVVDMFPRTRHVETVVLMSRVEK